MRLFAARAAQQLGARGREGEARAADERARGREAEAAKLVDGTGEARGGRELVEPHGLVGVSVEAKASLLVEAAERVLRLWQALQRREADPLEGVRVRLGHALAR